MRENLYAVVLTIIVVGASYAALYGLYLLWAAVELHRMLPNGASI